MSSSGEVALQRRDPTLHIAQGDKKKYDTAHTPPSEHVFSSPEPTVMVVRPEVHIYHEHQPTQFTPRHKKCGTVTDTVIQKRTKMVGRVNKKDWKVNGTTERGQQRINQRQKRADKWIAKYGI